MTKVIGACLGTALFTPTRLPVSSLNPSSTAASFDALVALVWPYSSSTKTLSLLLVDRDVRLRKSKGQVKVTFHGTCAKQVAQSYPGIGDSVRLGLEGAEWRETGDAVLTPGKKIDWDVEFRTRVVLELGRSSGESLTIDFRAPVEKITNGISHQSDESEGINEAGPVSVRLPPFVRSRDLSGSFIHVSPGPFADKDGFVAGIGRKRTRFARRSGSWKLVGSDLETEKGVALESENELGESSSHTPSSSCCNQLEPNSVEHDALGAAGSVDAPVSPNLSISERRLSAARSFNRTAGLGDNLSSDKEIMEEIVRAQDSDTLRLQNALPLASSNPQLPTPKVEVMGPPKKATTTPQLNLAELATPEAALTPRLAPLLSPGLPLVSPLVQRRGLSSSYFPNQDGRESELDASGIIEFEHRGMGSIDSIMHSSTTHLHPEVTDGVGHLDDFIAWPQSPLETHLAAFNANNISESRQSPKAPPKVENVAEVSVDISPGHFVEPPPGPTFVGQVEVQTKDSPPEEEEDDDMYGSPAIKMAADLRAPNLSEPVSYPPPVDSGAMSQERISVSAIDSEMSHKVYPPAFPSVYNWNGRQRKSQADVSSRQTMDGVSDQSLSDEEGSRKLSDKSDESHNDIQIAIQDIIPSDAVHRLRSGNDDSPNLNAKRGQPADGERHHSLPDTENAILHDAPLSLQFPMTPESTQVEEVRLLELQPSGLNDSDKLLPTPQATQDLPVIDHAAAVLPEISEEIESMENVESTTQQSTHVFESKPRRMSERLTSRFSKAQSIEAGSVYFTPRHRKSAATPRQQGPSPLSVKDATSPQESRNPANRISSADNADGSDDLPQRTRSDPSGLTTPDSYYTPLSRLSEQFNQLVDVLAVCTTTQREPQRSTSGPKDYYCTVHLVDSSLRGSATTAAQLFRPSQKALPFSKRGDVMLFRHFRVQSKKRKCMLLSTLSSAWAVFSETERRNGETSTLSVSASGPPAEFGTAEEAYVRGLMKWWAAEGDGQHTSRPLECIRDEVDGAAMSQAVQSTEPPSPTLRRSTRRKTNYTDNDAIDHNILSDERARRSESLVHELRNGTRWTDDTSLAGSQSRGSENVVLGLRDGTTYASRGNHDKSQTSARSESVVHELRDGTTYTDEGSTPGSVKKMRRGSVVHELRDGYRWVDG